MRKEVIVAVISGLAIGLLLAFGAVRISLKKSLISESSQGLGSPLTRKDQPQQNSDNKLTFTNLENGTIYTESPLTITGLGAGGASILISTDKEDFITQSGADGSFSQSIDLNKGVNTLIVESIDGAGNVTDNKTFTVVYYPNFEKDLNGS